MAYYVAGQELINDFFVPEKNTFLQKEMCTNSIFGSGSTGSTCFSQADKRFPSKCCAELQSHEYVYECVPNTISTQAVGICSDYSSVRLR